MKNYNLSTRELKARAIYTKAIAGTTVDLLIRLALLVAASAILSMTTNAQKNFNNVDANGVILDGYDAVAFLQTINR